MDIIEKIKEKYSSIFKNKDIKIVQLKQSGSYRQYYRIFDCEKTVLGVYNPDNQENEAFLSFTEHFLNKNLNVPEVISRFDAENIYFIKDLGDLTLFDFLQTNPKSEQILKYYKKILEHLILFQTKGIENLDLSKCYPRREFDRQSIMWDLNYFKYMVLKIAKIGFSEQFLEDDFSKLTDILLSAPSDFFLYRDFQSKNIMLVDDVPYFIDYQGGRKGAFYYDLASLLFDSKANLSEEMKNELKNYYYELINKNVDVNKDEFERMFKLFSVVRILQAFGAYGFRGIVERKQHFISSIPKALENIAMMLDNQYITKDEFPELYKSLILLQSSELAETFRGYSKNLLVNITSFSYHKNGYPPDETGNKGGFVFDCRFLPNPGRIEYYKKLSALDEPVKAYLEGYAEVEVFISDVIKMITNAAKNYSKMAYPNLQVNFGCTGGRHRSVYCAEKTAEILSNLYGLTVAVNHLQKNEF